MGLSEVAIEKYRNRKKLIELNFILICVMYVFEIFILPQDTKQNLC